MVMVTINGKEHYFDGYLEQNNKDIEKLVDLEWDGIIYVGGYEGDGKSAWASQEAYRLDPTYNLKRCVFTPQQFIDAVDTAQKKQAIVYDEAQEVFESSNRDTMSLTIKMLMTRIRKKQLYIIIVAPDFWRINKYLFIHRSRAFVRVYSNGFERGFFAFYNREKKHELYVRGKKDEKLCVPPNFVGRFTKWWPFDKEEYEDLKDKSIREVTAQAKNKQADKYRKRYTQLMRALNKADKDGILGFTAKSYLAVQLGVTTHALNRNMRLSASDSQESSENADFAGQDGEMYIQNNLSGDADE